MASSKRLSMLKKELKQQIERIIEGQRINVELAGEIMETIFSLKAVQPILRPPFPKIYICPISGQVMNDPVIIYSGQTYNRPSIVKWHSLGRTTCPLTEEPFSLETVIPNDLVRELLLSWCKNQGVPELAQFPIEELTSSDVNHFSSLHIKSLVVGSPEQKTAAKELLRLISDKPAFGAHFGKSPDSIIFFIGAIFNLETDPEYDPQIHEDMIAILFNLSLHGSNKLIVLECKDTMPVLIKALEAEKIGIRCEAAKTIRSLSAVNSSAEVIGKSDALKLLIELLKENDMHANKQAIEAISILCFHPQVAELAVRAGIVPILVEKVKGDVFVDEMLLTIRLVSVVKQACGELESLEFVSMLFPIFRCNPFSLVKEAVLEILHNGLEHECAEINSGRFIWKKTISEEKVLLRTIARDKPEKTKILANKIRGILNKKTVTSDGATSLSTTPP